MKHRQATRFPDTMLPMDLVPGKPDKVRIARLLLRKSQQQCADECGVSKGTWCRYELGARVPESPAVREYIERLTSGRVPASAWES